MKEENYINYKRGNVLKLNRNTEIYDLNEEDEKEKYFESQKFLEYYKKKNPEKVNVLVNTKKKRKNINEKIERISSRNNNTENYLKMSTKYIHVESQHRDKTLWPNPNNYTLDNINISNVVSASIISCYFINTLLTIKSTPIGLGNNKIYWQNISDTSGGNLYTYVATIPDGNYNAITLANTIETYMNEIRRIGLNGSLHNVNVNIDQTTDTTTFESFESAVFSNPFSIQNLPGVGETYTDIEVEYTAWETVLSIGDSIIIEESSDVDNISSVFINTEHIIREKISSNIFIIRVNAIATSLATDEGGTSVIIKKRLRWKLLWEENETMYELLGFPKINTSFDYIHTNTQETYKNFDISGNGVRVKINHVAASLISNNLTTVITSSDHNLINGDIIYINSSTDNGIVYNHFKDLVSLSASEEEDLLRFISLLYNPEGLTISNVTSNTFTVGVPYEVITPVETYISGSVLDSDENGDVILKTINASIKLNPNPVIYLCCPQLGRELESDTDFIMNNPNTIMKDVFIPIHLPGSGLSTNFDTFIPITKHFNESPIHISKLTFQFRTTNGILVDFNENDHVFTIAINIIEQKLSDQNFSSKGNYYS